MTAATLLAVALALLVVPGAAICLAAGSTWRDAVAAGPALTLAVVAAGCVVTAASDMPWVPASAGAIALVALLCAGLVGPAARQLVGRARRRSRDEDDDEAAGPPAAHTRRADTGHARRPVHGRRDAARHDTPGGRGAGRWLSDVVVVVIAAVPAVQVLIATRGLAAIPQGWDALFHGGATRYIAETGRAGILDLAPVGQPANPHFYYPDTYHALASLLLHLPGDGSPGALNGLPGALNALSAVTGVVFVLAVAVLAGRLCGGSRLAAVGAALVAASCWTFPYLPLGRGPVLPFALGVAIIPGLVLLAEHIAGRRWRSRHRHGLGRASTGDDAPPPSSGTVPGLVAPALLLGAGLAGAWSVHPSVAMAAAIPLFVQAAAGLVAAPGLRPRVAVAGGFALAAVPAGLYAGWVVTRVSPDTTDALAGFSWPRHMGVPRAVAGVFDLGPTAVSSTGITVLVLIGLVVAVTYPRWRRPLVAMVATLVIYGTLYVLAAAVEGDWVRMFTGYWWDDAYRFASLLVLPTAVLAGAGARALIPRGSLRRPAARTGVAVAAVCALAVVSGQAVLARDLRVWGFDDGPAVNALEREVLDLLAERYDGGVVLNDPFDGTGWVYALHGVPVVFGAPLADDPVAQVGADRMTLYTSINRYGFDPSITYEVQRQDVRWVVVGTGVVGGPGRPGGFIGLHLNPNLRLVAENEGSRLYEVLPVPADHPPLLPPPGIPPMTPPEQPPNTDSPVVDVAGPGPATSLGGTG